MGDKDVTKVEPINGRQRDLLFETVAEVCDWDISQLTKSARGALNRACSELRDMNPPPTEIRSRARRFAEKFPGATLTPSALVKHWPSLSTRSANPFQGAL